VKNRGWPQALAVLAAGLSGLPGYAQDLGIEVVVPAPYVWRGGAEAIEFRSWRWHPVDDPGLALPVPPAPEGLSLPSAARTGQPINDLRGWRTPGPAGWMRLAFMVEPAGLGQDTILALKGVAADVDIHINGRLMLQAHGAVDRPWDRVLEVPVPGSLLRAKDNVLALRLEAWPGFPGIAFVGFRGAFAALRPEEPVAPVRAPAWIADPAGHPQGLPPLEPGTGRTGRRLQRPLLTCEMDVDSWKPLVEVGQAGWSGRIRAPGKPVAETVFVTARGKTGRVLERRTPDGAGLWRVYQPLLAPGWVVEALDAQIVLEVAEVGRFTRCDSWGCIQLPLPDGRPATSPGASPWMLLESRSTSVPLLLASDDRRPFEAGIATRDGTMSIALEPGQHLRVLWPEGAWAATGARSGTGPDSARLARARFWASAALPWASTTVATGYTGDGRMMLEDRWRHLPFGSTPVAVLPPALGLRATGNGNPAWVRTDAPDLDVTTPEGPLLGLAGDRIAYAVPAPRRQPVRRITSSDNPGPWAAGAVGYLDQAARDALALPWLDTALPLTPSTAPREALARVWRDRAWERTPTLEGSGGLRWLQAWLDTDRQPVDAVLETGPVLDRTARMTDAGGMRALGASVLLAQVTDSLGRHQDPASLLIPTGVEGREKPDGEHAVAAWLAMTGSWRLAPGREEPRWKALAARLGPLAADPGARTRWRRCLGIVDRLPPPTPSGRAETREGQGWPLTLPRPAEAAWLNHPDVVPGLREVRGKDAWLLASEGVEVLAGRHRPDDRSLELALRLRHNDRRERRIILLLPEGAVDLARVEADTGPGPSDVRIRKTGGRHEIILEGTPPEGPLTLRFRYA